MAQAESITRRGLLAAGAGMAVAGIARPADAAPGVSLQVLKSKRRLDILSGGKIVKSYPVRLGFQPEGPKRFQGDGKTPEGVYRISGRNPQSAFFRSFMIDYPRRLDRAYAMRHGRSAGGNICIHGQINGQKGVAVTDWTRGCIALSNKDMADLWDRIPVGCQVAIFA